MKTINGKAIYSPGNRAAEYGRYACNFFAGCSNGCQYCYLRKGVLAHAMGGNEPTLKKCFKDEDHALEVFEKELLQNLPELQKHGLFFSFTGDWALKECIELTLKAVDMCIENQIYVKLLSKRADFIDKILSL
jgi:DNA repair photolyase